MQEQNLEIKVRLSHEITEKTLFVLLEKQWPQLRELTHKDTFFGTATPGGLFKLREETEDCTTRGYLVFYQRPIDRNPKVSDFTKTDYFYDVEKMKKILSSTNQVLGTVTKTRKVFIQKVWMDPDNTVDARIHYDAVEGLGRFMEIEILVSNLQGEEKDRMDLAKEAMNKLMWTFKIRQKDLVYCSYYELLHKGHIFPNYPKNSE